MINFLKAYSNIGTARTVSEKRNILSNLKALIIKDEFKDTFTKGANREYIAIDITTEDQNYFYTLILLDRKIFLETLGFNGDDVIFRDRKFNYLIPELHTNAEVKVYNSLQKRSFLSLPNAVEITEVKPFIEYFRNLNPETCELPQLCLADRY